jgi:hypothetical protein
MIIKDPVAPLLSSTLLLFSSCGVVGQDNEHCTAIDEKPPCHAQALQREEVVSVSTMDHRRRRILGAVAAVVMVVAFGCSRDCPCPGAKPVCLPPSNAGRVTITQGIWGDVWFWQGDFMPICPTGTVTAVAREMRIHELTSWHEVDEVPGRGAPFYSAIHTPLVATVHSDEKGFFQVELPPGVYSLFAVEDSLFYANGFDGSGNIYPVLVNEGEVTKVRFDINYMAAW